MAAPKNNQFWKLRTKHGREKIFSTPEILWEAVCEYFEWCDKNPLNEVDYKTSMKTIRKVKIPKIRAYTMSGLCIFLGINTKYFFDFEKGLKNKKDEISLGFSEICTRIREIVYTQKFTNAAAGLLNPNLIARDLGIRDESKVDHSSKDGTMTPKQSIVVVDKETKKELEKMQNEND